jgi:very-short-patch-repair endonuclease
MRGLGIPFAMKPTECRLMWEVMTRSDLIRSGMTSRDITSAVRTGALIRARQDRYLPGEAPARLVEAVRVGGRLGCLSLLAAMGIFVFESTVLHVHMSRGASRMRSAGSRRARLPARGGRHGVRLHWHPLLDPPTSGCVAVIDALVHAVRCQSPRHAIATLDSAINSGALGDDRLGEIFAALPRRFGVLREFVDGRSQSGPETLVRLMALALGCRVEIQVKFDGVGFVDIVLDGWLVVECDSRQFHSTWRQQLKDYRRDKMLAKQGFCVLRLAAADILYEPESVLDSLRGLVHSRR